MHDDQCMILLIQVDILLDRLFEQRTQPFVVFIAARKPITSQESTRVSIDHEDRLIQGIQQNIVGGLRAHPVYPQQGGALIVE